MNNSNIVLMDVTMDVVLRPADQDD